MGAWGIIRGSGGEKRKYESEIITQTVREENGNVGTYNMLTPFVCIPVHYIKPGTLRRFSGSS